MVKKKYLLLIAVIAVIAGLSVLYLVSKAPIKTPVKEEKPSAKISEELPPGVTPLPHTKQTYQILTDKPKNPQIIQVDLDPLGVKVGESQIITVKVKDTESKSITNDYKVEGIIFTDNASTTIPFRLARAEASEDGFGLVTTWEGHWKAEDTTYHTYMVTIIAKNSTGQSKTDLSFR
ncbi:MAG: hypothetical protein DRP89_07600 [Candidatus Neomarinimicrobiota bacterium]|nr:MAG: hypothetical protein DRP89_07600 [Candidatus Neomarinimicrobiota bacterium]